MAYVISPAETPSIPILDSRDSFPVNRIYCVGQNYSAHVREMGGDPRANPPVFFSKPADAIVINNAAVTYPLSTRELHYEVELVVALGSGGSKLSQEDAQQHVLGYAVGIDLTRRDLQALAKKGGKPWDVAKGFDQSAPVSGLKLAAQGQPTANAAIWLELNGERRQAADLSDMIWSVPEIIAALSHYFELRAGDLIFTGTPSGVGAVVARDHIRAGIDGVGELQFEIVERPS